MNRGMAKKSVFLIVLLAVLFAFTSAYRPCSGKEYDPIEVDPILNSAESLFVAMKVKDYPAIWAALTIKSRKTIAGEVYKFVKTAERDGYSIEAVNNDFARGGPTAKSYWTAFLENFSPDVVLEQSRWEMGPVQRGRAEIDILFRKSVRPAKLKMFLEDGQWRVGLVETFWGRK
jgi:hypothetical protein